MYSIISQLITTNVCDYIMFEFGTKLYKLEIISSKYEEISKFIMLELGRGVTLFNVKGCYTNEEKIEISKVFTPY